ncbi:hypothetical protein TRFO_12730 [Tritrichomonas foetus]|uniref:DnaK protein n=1 Tax=Tritrichomonas foetus TaxID=1144522 RepID=A0A1J4L0K0_9EUKA|nr:hypothetical protein TRFO_12730 [Tritrichomonas foetus]|eukprot:OHT17031.1 hypothetical protein TRFO_12730 [Tritrichomonas foetus]
MFFSLLALISLRAEYLGIDLGSQYFKMAESTLTGDARIVKSGSKVTTPAAVAIRSSRPLNYPLKPADFSDIQLRFGDAALNILKNNATLGYSYLPRVIGRYENETQFGNPKLNISSAMFSLALNQYIHHFNEVDGVTLVAPSYWTRMQMRQAITACELFQIPFISMVDDISAMAMLYGATRSKRCENNHHVLFVDVGFSGVRAYSATFSKISSSSYFANETSYFWSEKTGGYFFTKAVADEKKIPFNKAQKLLIRSSQNFNNLFSRELDEIKKVVSQAAEQARERSGEIDELQLIGGASVFPFVVEAIKSASNISQIHRDFNANEALALAAAYTSMAAKGVAARPVTTLLKRPNYNLTLKFNKAQKYCTRGGKCEATIKDSAVNLTKLTIVAPIEELPEGSREVMMKYRIRNETFSKEKANYQFNFQVPYPTIDRAYRCVGNDCEVVVWDGYLPNDHFLFEENDHFLRNYLVVLEEREKAEALIPTVDELLIKLAKYFDKSNEVVVEAKTEITEEMKEAYQKHLDTFESGAIRQMNEAQILKIVIELRNILKSLE